MLGNAFWKFVFESISEEMFTNVMKKLAGKITGKVAEKVQKRVEKILGGDTEQAGKDITDEVIYAMVVSELTDAQADDIDAFEMRLRREDKEKAEAFVLFIATVVMKFQKEVKKTTGPKKGESGPTISESYTDFAKGIEYAKKILEALLRVTGATADETFNNRVAFLEGKNVFSLIKAKKSTSSLDRWIQSLEESACSFLKEKSSGVQSSFEEVVVKLEKTVVADCNDAGAEKGKSASFFKKLFIN